MNFSKYFFRNTSEYFNFKIFGWQHITILFIGILGIISIIKRIAKFTLGVVTQNIVFALVIKVAILILSAIGFANMWIAVFADVGVAMICILNSFRALYKK